MVKSMALLVWLLSKISSGVILLVGLFTWVTLSQVFVMIENAFARWLCAALYVLFWPDFLCSAVLTSSEMQDRENLYFAGGAAFLTVSAGCLYDHLFPHLTQHRFHSWVSWVPACPGLQLTATAALLLGYVVAARHIDRVRPKREKQL
jgi:hypothetical protein